MADSKSTAAAPAKPVSGGDASGVSILLANHHSYGLAERCCYHFELLETLTSIPFGRGSKSRGGRRRGLSISSMDDETSAELTKTKDYLDRDSSNKSTDECSCGVVSLLECVSSAAEGKERRRALRTKHREFNTRAKIAWRRNTRGSSKRRAKVSSRMCHQPSRLPLPLSINTRVSFAYELTSIAVVVDASPSFVSLSECNYELDLYRAGGGNGGVASDPCCIPLDRLGPNLVSYFRGLVQPIELPPVAISGVGVTFGKWTPNLAVTVVAVYPPSDEGGQASASVLVRDWRICDEVAALKLTAEVEKWARSQVEDTIATRISSRDATGINSHGNLSALGDFALPFEQSLGSWANATSFMNDMLEFGDAALKTLPKEGRPLVLICSDCKNVHCSWALGSFGETTRADVPISVLDLSGLDGEGPASTLPMNLSGNSSTSMRDLCHSTGGYLMDSATLEAAGVTKIGSNIDESSPLYSLQDHHYLGVAKKRSLRPNLLQWLTLFSLSPFSLASGQTPSIHHQQNSTNRFDSLSSMFSSIGGGGHQAEGSLSDPIYTQKSGDELFVDSNRWDNSIFVGRYVLEPVRIKSLLMTRILEGYRAKKYGAATHDNDKVSIIFTRRLAELGLTLHYEIYFVSSPFHSPFVGTASVQLLLSGDRELILLTKNMFKAEKTLHASAQASSAERVSKFLRWTKKQDLLDSFLCTPGWAQNVELDSDFVVKVQSMTHLQRYRHFRTEHIEVVTVTGNPFETSNSLFSDVMEGNTAVDELFECLAKWSSHCATPESRHTYIKIIESSEHDLIYYCLLRCNPCPKASRLYEITVEFHGEIDPELRLAVRSSLVASLHACDHLIVLEKEISNLIQTRSTCPRSESRGTCVDATSMSPFLQHRFWRLPKDDDVLPLLTKRRIDIGKFFILSTSQDKMIFAKFAQDDGSECSETVIYQVLSTESDLFVDLYMEYSRGLFHQLRAGSSPFYLKYQNVKRRDKNCGTNLIARRNLLKLIDGVSMLPLTEAGLCEDTLRIVKCSSSSTSTLLKFFDRTSHLANEMLSRYLVDFIVSDHFTTPSAKLPTCYSLAGKKGIWLVMRVDWYVLSIAVLEDDDDSEGIQDDEQPNRRLSFFTAGIIDLYKSDGDFAEADSTTCDEENFGVCTLVDIIQHAHARKYSLSCFHALQKDVLPMSSVDVDFVEDPLTFHEVLNVLVELDDISSHLNDNTSTITGTKLGSVIERLLGVVPGSNASMFFYKGHKVGEGLATSEGSDVSQAPIFFKFMLDSRLASMEDILALQKTVTVTALVSNFGVSDDLSPCHLEAVERLERSLNAFASERILDKLRFKGRTLAKCDFELIQQNIQATHNLTMEVPCEFFVARANALIAANNPSGSESDINYCFVVLLQMLKSSELTIVAREDAFLLLVDNEVGVLPYWCFAELDQSNGTIRLIVHHPLGREYAQEILTKAEHLVKGIVKISNQQLLLIAAYKSKSGSDLLLGANAPFACPCQFTAEMPLNRRVLPQQAISQLEALPMVANFILSNHESIFVYKEVSESIFYMQLEWVKLDESDEEFKHNPHQISLRVYGIEVPGHSIKIDLVRMLRRKMMNLPLDALSSVLQKNSSFSLTSSDMQFVRGFAKQLKDIEGDPEPVLANVQHYYLPTIVQDPTVLLLMFRQNIFGSTFIMKLHHELEEELENKLDEDFLFYFNSSPSKLDPSYQSSTTLTSRGRIFARQAGSGIAFIQVSVEGEGRQSAGPISLDAPLSHRDFTLAEKNNGHLRVKVEVINTTTDASVIHKWVALSLSQALCAFAIERLIEAAREIIRSKAKILPGLISLRGMIMFADNIPHPAVASVRFNDRLRATVLANLSLEMLNAVILDTLSQRHSNVNGIDILRREKQSSALVILSKERGNVCAKMAVNGKRVDDKPTDCPEYFVVIGLNRDIKSFEEETRRVRFFEAVSTSLVSAHDKESTFLRLASRMKGINPSQFERRMGIMLYVSRTSRELLTYNLNLQTRVQMETRMGEIEQRYLSEELTGRASLHRRCLGSIASLFSDESKPERAKPVSTPTVADRSLDNKPAERTEPSSMPQKQGTAIQTRRRIPRPTSMLRPTLIGKSVDGSALQAVQASRLRARSRPSIPQRSSPSIKPIKSPSPQRRETKSGAADPKKKSAGSLKSPTPAQPQRALIAAYKAYVNILKSTPLDGPWLGHAPLHNIVHKFLATDVKPVSIARLISMSCCNLVHSQSTSTRPFGDSIAFMSFLSKQWKVHGLRILAKDSDESSFLYLIKDITTSQSRRVSILIELAAGNDPVVHMKTFLLFSRPLNANLSNVVSLRHRENEVGIISAIVHDFIARMGHIGEHIFNFWCHRSLSEALPEFGLHQLLESTLARFSEDYQSRRLLPFRLQRRFLDISSYLVLFDRSSLIDHLHQNLGLYNLRDRSQGAVCLVLRTVSVNYTVFIYIMPHRDIETAFDIFILCLTRSENINGYIVEEGFQRAHQISAVILFSSMTKVSSMLDRASSNIRKMKVWNTFGLGFAGAGDVASMDYIQELRATSNNVDAINSGANEELTALLTDEGNDFHLNWHEVFASIRNRGADFFLHVIECDQTDSGTDYIVYGRNDTFLDISFDAAKRVEHARVLLKALDSGNEDASADETFHEFLLFVLQWLWKDTEKEFLGGNA